MTLYDGFYGIMDLSVVIHAGPGGPRVTCGLIEEVIEERVAVVELFSPNDKVTGEIAISQKGPRAPLEISGLIDGLSPGMHGINVHNIGRTEDMCKAAGDKYNPFELNYQDPESNVKHVGDFGTVEADESGIVVIEINDNLASLYGSHSILDRSILISRHGEAIEGTDNTEEAVACGVIEEMVEPGPEWILLAPENNKDIDIVSFLCHLVKVPYVPGEDMVAESECQRQVTITHGSGDEVRVNGMLANGVIQSPDGVATIIKLPKPVTTTLISEDLILKSAPAQGKLFFNYVTLLLNFLFFFLKKIRN